MSRTHLLAVATLVLAVPAAQADAPPKDKGWPERCQARLTEAARSFDSPSETPKVTVERSKAGVSLTLNLPGAGDWRYSAGIAPTEDFEGLVERWKGWTPLPEVTVFLSLGHRVGKSTGWLWANCEPCHLRKNAKLEGAEKSALRRFEKSFKPAVDDCLAWAASASKR